MWSSGLQNPGHFCPSIQTLDVLEFFSFRIVGPMPVS